jgi:hypothetical protein
VHAENFDLSSICKLISDHKYTKESHILLIWISFALYLDQFKPLDISGVFSFTNPLIIQSLQADATLTIAGLVTY